MFVDIEVPTSRGTFSPSFLGLVGGSRCEPEEEIPIFFGHVDARGTSPQFGCRPKDKRLMIITEV